MAKKPLYSPNLGLIAGAGNVAKAESELSSSGSSFVKGFMGVFQANMLEKEKSKALVDAYASSVKTPDNITLFDGENKLKVLNFVRNVRSEVVELSKAYAKTGDLNILDEIQMKKASIVNLNNQISSYNNEAKQYIKADRAGQIARGKNFAFAKHDIIWTKNGELNIEANGDLGFTTPSGYDKYNDVTNTWNVNNNTYNTSLLRIDEGVYGNAQKGGNFDRTGVINNLQNFLSKQGPEEIQVALESNIAGDDSYVIGQNDKGEDIYAANLSFEAMWSSGQLNEKFYKGFKPMNKEGEYDSSWMFQDANSGKAARLLATYNTDVLQTRHENNFVDKNNNNENKDIDLNPFGKGGNSRIVDATGKSISIANPERNNRRRSVMNIVNEKPGAGSRFVGTLGDYEWDKEAGLWRSGEETYETIDLMKDERLYFAGGEFESGLGISSKDQEKQEKETLTPIQKLQRTFTKQEEQGKLDLEKILPANYSFQEKGADAFGIDAVEIFDEEMNSLGVYGFDFSNPKKAKERAEFFYNKFGPEGLDVLKMNTSQTKNPTSGMSPAEKIKYYTDNQ